MKVGIVGSRDYPDLEAVRAFVRSLAKGTTVISGGARGVDDEAAGTARECGLVVVELKPDPATIKSHSFSRAAHERNRQIAEASEGVVAFWDGKSTGTRSTLRATMARGKPLVVFYPNGMAEEFDKFGLCGISGPGCVNEKPGLYWLRSAITKTP